MDPCVIRLALELAAAPSYFPTAPCGSGQSLQDSGVATPLQPNRAELHEACVVTISITLGGYEAVSATLPDGYVAEPPHTDERASGSLWIARPSTD